MGDLPHEFVTLSYYFEGGTDDGGWSYSDWCELDGEWSYEVTIFSDSSDSWVAKKPQYGGMVRESQFDGPKNWEFI